MENQAKKVFQFRAFISLLTAFSFLLSVLSGIALFLAPSGRIANRIGWTFWGIDKHQWGDLHTWLCLLFTVACLFHIVLNFRPIINYLKIFGSRMYRIRFEWLIALAVCVLIFAGTLYQWKPFSRLFDLRDRIQQRWDQPAEAALSVPDNTGSGGGQGGQGRGLGQLTLRQVCEQNGLDPAQAVQRLHVEGITAEPEMTMRQIADLHDLHPSQLREILLPGY